MHHDNINTNNAANPLSPTAVSFAIHLHCLCISMFSGHHSRLPLAFHATKSRDASVVRDWAGADAVVCACITAPAAALVGHRIILLRVDILRAARHRFGPVLQGQRHTATLDQEDSPEPSPQIGVLREGRQSS